MLTAGDLFCIAQNCVSAMVFLESKHLVHRALMARRFLMGGTAGNVKLANLGAARDVYCSEIYVTKENSKSSTTGNNAEEHLRQQESRWLAPECIRDGEFSHASNVWAMGVVLYEIFSYARSPYGSLSPREVTSEVNAGQRLGQPPACPNSVYHVMNRMWAL
jgi:serine/threonine protein kinase